MTATPTIAHVQPSDAMVASPDTDAPRRGSVAYVVFLACGALAMGVYFGPARAGWSRAALSLALGFTCVGFVVRAAVRARGRTRVIWTALGGGLATSTFSTAVSYVAAADGVPLGFPAVTDLMWLSAYPCYALGLGVLAIRRRRAERWGDRLDFGIIVVGGAALMWAFAIAPVVHAPDLTLLGRAVSVSYPLVDLLLFAALVRLVVGTGTGLGAVRLLAFGFSATLVADLVYAFQVSAGTYDVGDPVDALWFTAYLLGGAAALHPSARDLQVRTHMSGSRVSGARLAFLGVAVLTAPVVIALSPSEHTVLAGASIVSFLLVMTRVTGLNRQLAVAGVELERRASTDSLTGLANRATFAERLESAMSRPAGNAIGVMFIDLDDFKYVNDNLGHAAGDDLLRVVARRLVQTVRPEDLVARLGGDEFAVMLDDVPEDVAIDIGHRAVAALAVPAEIAGRPVPISVSVGLATRRDGVDLAGLMRDADVAMYAAKSAGKNQVKQFVPAMHESFVPAQR